MGRLRSGPRGTFWTGRIEDTVYRMRNSAIRIISARKASRKEVAEYEHNARQD